MIRFLSTFSARINKLLMAMAGVLLVLMMLLACSNMVTRAFWVPIKGSYELMGFFGATAIAFSLGYTQLLKDHLSLTIISDHFSPTAIRIIDIFTSLICCIFFVLVSWKTASWAVRLIQSGELSETLRIAYYPFVFAVSFGLGTLALALLTDFLLVLFDAKQLNYNTESGK